MKSVPYKKIQVGEFNIGPIINIAIPTLRYKDSNRCRSLSLNFNLRFVFCVALSVDITLLKKRATE